MTADTLTRHLGIVLLYGRQHLVFPFLLKA
nr:MAG TPA: hypothetical protein [Caudoviricetes sp.]